MDDVEVTVNMYDFVCALRNLVPSLTLADLDRYDAIKEQYSSKGSASLAPKKPAALKLREVPKVKGPGLQLPARKKAAAVTVPETTIAHPTPAAAALQTAPADGMFL